MTTNKRKKSARFRATRTHGLGMKKGRGAGNRGGRGMAGTGKRADQNKPTVINKYGDSYLGKKGFKNAKQSYKSINLDALDRKVDALAKEGKAELKAGTYIVDLSKVGVSKLLGNGSTTKKMKITVDMASNNAIEKVKKAGGEVITHTPAEEPAEE